MLGKNSNNNEINVNMLKRFAKRGARWLTGIAQVRDEADEHFGAFRNEYDMATKSWSFFDPFWHTAQGIRGLMALHMEDTAVKHGMFFLNNSIINSPKDRRFHGAHQRLDGHRAGLLATTSITDGIEGLIDYFLLTRDKKTLDTLTRIEEWLNNTAYDPVTGFYCGYFDSKSGELYAQNTYRSDNPEEHPEFCGRRPEAEGSALLYLGLLLNKPESIKRFKYILDYLSNTQAEDGIWWNWFCNSCQPRLAHGRYNLWLAFALLNGYEYFGEKKYYEAALKTARFYRRAQQLDGVIFYKTNSNGQGYAGQICGSASAMAALLWLKLLKYDFNEDFANGIKLSLNFLNSTQFSEDFHDKNLRGACFEASKFANKQGFCSPHIRDLATIFALQLAAQVIGGLKAGNWFSFEEYIVAACPFPWPKWPVEKLLNKTSRGN
jgi:hypothetical protein